MRSFFALALLVLTLPWLDAAARPLGADHPTAKESIQAPKKEKESVKAMASPESPGGKAPSFKSKGSASPPPPVHPSSAPSAVSFKFGPLEQVGKDWVRVGNGNTFTLKYVHS